jgi:adenylate cyclase
MNKDITNFFRENGKWIVINILVWCVAKQLFIAIKLWGVENTGFDSIHLSPWYLFLVISVSGAVDGFIFGLVDVWFDKQFKKYSLIQGIAIKSLINLFLSLMLMILIFPILSGVNAYIGIPKLASLLLTSNLIIVAVYLLLMSTLLQLIKLVLSWVNAKDMFDLMTNNSIEEERIFLFLDMKSSTAHAETLGAQRYSALVRDCFRDISIAVKENGAEVYQYIGDEAVLTWKVSEENFQHSVRLYFRFKEILRFGAPEYRKQFGFVPEFKAGIHYGKVIKAQVGVVRKEIAFHGDAINTASRIQRKCGELMRELLVSESVRDRLPRTFRCDWEGNYQLKGKESEINLYSIQRMVAV